MMIGLIHLFHNKYSNLAFKIKNETLSLPLYDITFFAIG